MISGVQAYELIEDLIQIVFKQGWLHRDDGRLGWWIGAGIVALIVAVVIHCRCDTNDNNNDNNNNNNNNDSDRAW